MNSVQGKIMILSAFKKKIRLLGPSANSGKVNATTLTTLINDGVRKVNTLAKAYCGEKYFSVVEDKSTYNLRDIEPTFTLIGQGGIWMNKGTADTPYWKKLDGVDRRFLDREYPNWVNQGSAVPLFYIIEAGKVIFYPKPNADLDLGFWIPDFLIKPTDMTADAQYPFTGTTDEISDLEPLDDAIIYYVEWHLDRAVGKDQVSLITRKEFEIELRRMVKSINRRPDISTNWRYLQMRGRRRKIT